ncbi:hypothetical protein HAX54_031386, partial [Datura stramonium]|nr:hypothetical protein [Datura stramonium]
APKSKRKLIQAWDVPEDSTSHDLAQPFMAPDLNESNTEKLGHASGEEPLPRPSPLPSSSKPSGIQKLAEMTRSHENELQWMA